MKLHNLWFIMMFFYVWLAVGMEVPLALSLNDFPEDVLIRIIALVKNRHVLRLINRKFSLLAAQNNIDNFIIVPYELGKNEFFKLLVRYSIENKEQHILLAVKNASKDNRSSILKTLYLFINDNATIKILMHYIKTSCSECLKIIVPLISKMCNADQALYSYYRNEHKIELVHINNMSKEFSLLQLATNVQQLDVVRLLLQQQYYKLFNFQSTLRMFQRTPWHIAIYNHDLNIIKLLRKYFPYDINTRSASGKTPLFVAVTLLAYQNNCAIKNNVVKELLDAGADPNLPSIEGLHQTVLFIAVNQDFLNIETFQSILEKKAIVNKKDIDGITPLMQAAVKGKPLFVQALLNKGADFMLRDIYGSTVLHKAVEQGQLEVVKLLVEYKDLLDLINLEGNSPLAITVFNYDRAKNWKIIDQIHPIVPLQNLLNSYPIAEVLLEAGSDPNLPLNKRGDTPFMYVLDFNNDIMARLFLKYGADSNIKKLKKQLLLRQVVLTDEMKNIIKESKKEIAQSEKKKKVELLKKNKPKDLQHSENCIIS